MHFLVPDVLNTVPTYINNHSHIKKSNEKSMDVNAFPTCGIARGNSGLSAPADTDVTQLDFRGFKWLDENHHQRFPRCVPSGDFDVLQLR